MRSREALSKADHSRIDDVTVTSGSFSVQLDFGADAFPNANRFLEIGVRPGADTGAYTVLGPRQQITSSPFAIPV